MTTIPRFDASNPEHLRLAKDFAETVRREIGRPEIYGKAADDSGSAGAAFVRSAQYKGWTERFPSGAPSSGPAWSDPAELRLGVRALVTSADPSAGTLIRPDYRGLLEPGLVRPLTIRDLVTRIPVTTDAVEYVAELSRVDAAAPVAEATVLTGTSGLKPEGGVVFEARTAQVRTIAEWIPVTKRAVSDAPALRQYIDGGAHGRCRNRARRPGGLGLGSR